MAEPDDPCHSKLYIDSTKSPTISAIMFAAGIFGNVAALVILEIRRRRDMKAGGVWRRALFHVLITSLVVTDLAGTCLVSPIVQLSYSSNTTLIGMSPDTHSVCSYFGFSMTFFSLATMSLLFTTALERCFAIGYPYLYSRHVTKKCAYVTIPLVFVLCTLFCLLPFVGFGDYVQYCPGTWCFIDMNPKAPADRAYATLYASVMLVLVLAIVACNGFVVYQLFKMYQRRKRNGSVMVKTRTNSEHRQRSMAEEVEHLILLVFMTTIFIICTMPLVETEKKTNRMNLWSRSFQGISRSEDPEKKLIRMEEEEVEAVMSDLRKQLEDENLNVELKLSLLNGALNKALNSAALQTDDSALTRVKSQLYRSGVLTHCVRMLSLPPRMLRGNWSSAATLAQLTSSCCVGVEPHEDSEAFSDLFLPSVVNGILSLADRLMRTECVPLLRKVMDSLGWLLSARPQLASQVLSSVHYEQIQMCDDAAVSLLCVQMWTQTCASRNFLSALSSDSVLLLLNEAVSQLAVSADPAVGGASVRLILLMSSRLALRLRPLLLSFRGLDRLLEKDWRGRGFEQDVDQLIALIQSEDAVCRTEDGSEERARAACVIQAAWRSYRTRRRVRSLNRAVSSLQRRYRARRRQQQQRQEARQWEEELRYQVCVRRQQARRQFHQKQRELLQLLPADQVQPYLQECERRAAVLIQSFWRGCRERRRYGDTARRHTLTLARRRQQAARTLQRAVRRFLQKRRAAKAPPLPGFWIGREGLTDRRRAELKRQVEEYVAAHPSSGVSTEECVRLHEEAQQLLVTELQREEERRREERRRELLLVQTRTQLEKLLDAPPLSVVTATEADSFLSPSGHIAARARDAHNAAMQALRLPWWRILGESEETFSSAPQTGPEEDLDGWRRYRDSEDAGLTDDFRF